MESHTSDETRFAFGKNWKRYLKGFSEARLLSAVRSLQEMLEKSALVGETFLDVGCGSGIFSLAAYQLGAQVVSFDYDADSVDCANALKAQFAPTTDRWKVTRGSILDSAFVESLGHFSIVYSWGVLHHTGNLERALIQCASLVRPGGILFISIYNDQGAASQRWTQVKRWYNQKPVLRPILVAGSMLRLWGPKLAKELLRGRPALSMRQREVERGMSLWPDLIDWVGGYPFEVARPEKILDVYTPLGFRLLRLKTCAGGIGCNEYVFQKDGAT